MNGLANVGGAEPVLFQQFLWFSTLSEGVIHCDEFLWCWMSGAEHLSNAFAKSSETLMFFRTDHAARFRDRSQQGFFV